MRNRMRGFAFGALVFAVILVICGFAVAESDGSTNIYYIGSGPDAVVNAGKDTGYTENEKIDKDDPHYGWSIGSFYVSGYTRQTVDASGNPVFLKNVGDEVELWFQLDQDIKCLNGDDELIICEDTNGYDEYFGVNKTNFGRGVVIIRHTDYQNRVGEPVIYTDYLAANATNGAAVQVELFEEGDYEVALNYEIKDVGVTAFGEDFFSGYDNYRVFFRFSVRNGNCMVYPFDSVTGSELTNSATTENGFYLDMALSRYLDVDIKREVMNETADGLVEDVRFNRPAKDGEAYTEEGVYTITVKNKYTAQETVKVIYVGKDEVLSAHANSGIPVEQLKEKIENGSWMIEEGQVLVASSGAKVLSDSYDASEAVKDSVDTEKGYGIGVIIFAFIAGILIGGGGMLVYIRKIARK